MTETGREDLGSMFASITRRLVEAEAPLLAAVGLTMWEYVVLCELVRRPASSQLALAQDIRHDKTRLIALLDKLQEAGLIDRRPNPDDRRSHVVSITFAGRELHRTARAAIRKMEREILEVLDERQRIELLTILQRLERPQEPK